MAIIRFADRPMFYNPWAEFEKLRREMNTFTNFFDMEGMAPSAQVYPALNITEDKDNIYVRAEIPGVQAADLDIAVEGDSLVIKGERKACATEEKASYHRREIECGRFSRAVTLPVKVKVDNIRAESRNGVLKITMPKAEEIKPRQIKVNVG